MVPAARRQCTSAQRGCRGAWDCRTVPTREFKGLTFWRPLLLTADPFHMLHLPKVSSIRLELVSSCGQEGGKENDMWAGVGSCLLIAFGPTGFRQSSIASTLATSNRTS